jgi:archaeosine-15-forming tRNA-guanine transglycosylase
MRMTGHSLMLPIRATSGRFNLSSTGRAMIWLKVREPEYDVVIAFSPWLLVIGGQFQPPGKQGRSRRGFLDSLALHP